MAKGNSSVGIIGLGHLGSAIAAGLLDSRRADAGHLAVTDLRREAVDACPHLVHKESAATLAAECDVIFLCVRPADAQAVLETIHAPGKVIISTVAGLASATIAAETKAHVLRVMPNMAVALGEGALACAEPNNLDPAQLSSVTELLSGLGQPVFVPEEMFAAVTGLSGSGPAYCYVLLEGMIRGACELGMDEKAARALAAQTLIGAGSLVKSSDESLADLIAGVATPGGTTEAGVHVLEKQDFELAACAAVHAAALRADELSGAR